MNLFTVRELCLVCGPGQVSEKIWPRPAGACPGSSRLAGKGEIQQQSGRRWVAILQRTWPRAGVAMKFRAGALIPTPALPFTGKVHDLSLPICRMGITVPASSSHLDVIDSSAVPTGSGAQEVLGFLLQTCGKLFL